MLPGLLVSGIPPPLWRAGAVRTCLVGTASGRIRRAKAMTRKRAKPESIRNEGGRGRVLDRLSGAEAASVLNCLLQRHPELRSEADTIAADVLSDVSLLAVADDVENAVLQFDYDDLNARAGGHSWGYVEPSEAAWELLEEVVKPFIDDMKRYLELGLEEQARELCQGILLGLYRVRDGCENDVVGWSPDFPAEMAGQALEAWSEANRAGGQGGRQLSGDFVAEHIPEWNWVIKPGDGSK